VLSVKVEEDRSSRVGMADRYYLDGDEITGAVMSHVRQRLGDICMLQLQLPSGHDMLGVDWSIISDVMAYCKESGIAVSHYLAGKACEFHLLCWRGYTRVGYDPSSVEYIFDGQPIGRGQSGADILSLKAIARGAVVLFVWPDKAPTIESSANTCPGWPEGLEALWYKWGSQGVKTEYSYSK